MKAIRMALSERANILKAKWKELSKGTKRVILGIGGVLSVILIIAGCIHFDVPRRIRLRHRTEQVIKEDVTRYLEERYGEEFVITNVIPPGYSYASYIITAYKADAPQNLENEITIQGWNERGLITYYDNYPVVKLIPELNQYISGVVGDYFPENRVYVDFYKEWYNENLDINYSLKEFLNDKEGAWHTAIWCDICIPYNGKNEKELLDDIRNAVAHLGKNKISGFFFIDILYNNFSQLPESLQDLELGKNGKDFINYNFVIDKNGNIQ